MFRLALNAFFFHCCINVVLCVLPLPDALPGLSLLGTINHDLEILMLAFAQATYTPTGR